MPPKYANGKICYVEIPSVDVARSAEFYRAAFGWEIRKRGDGVTAFEDAVGEVSGAFVTGRPPPREAGFLIYIMVDDAAAAVQAIVAQGGEIVQPIGADAPEVTARFRDPAGNVIGIYQEPTLAERRRSSVPALALLIAAALTILGCAKPPTATEKGARLMAHLKKASGGAALDTPAGFHEAGTVVRGGVTGTYEVWADLHALRSTGRHTFDNKTGTSGFDGQTAWTVGPAGAVQVDTSPHGLSVARLGTYLTIFGFFYPDRFPARFEYRGRRQADGVEYDVVTATPADSLPADLWLDVQTHRLQRITGSDGTVAFTGVVKRYEVVDGVWIPFALSQTEGTHEFTQEITSFAYGPVPAERFAPPAR
jgi:uncharacterized protein